MHPVGKGIMIATAVAALALERQRVGHGAGQGQDGAREVRGRQRVQGQGGLQERA